jgi:hypothetical protein
MVRNQGINDSWGKGVIARCSLFSVRTVPGVGVGAGVAVGARVAVGGTGVAVAAGAVVAVGAWVAVGAGVGVGARVAVGGTGVAVAAAPQAMANARTSSMEMNTITLGFLEQKCIIPYSPDFEAVNSQCQGLSVRITGQATIEYIYLLAIIW